MDDKDKMLVPIPDEGVSRVGSEHGLKMLVGAFAVLIVAFSLFWYLA